MAAGYLDLFVEQGEDFLVSVTVDGINSEPYNLINHTIKTDIRKSYWSANSTAHFTANVADPESGVITLTLPANTTQSISSGRYVYDIFVTDTMSNTRSKVLEGILHMEPSATKI